MFFESRDGKAFGLMSKNRIFAFILGIFVAAVLISGAGFLSSPIRLLGVSLFGLLILSWAFWCLRGGLPNKASYFALLIIGLGLGLMVLQLLPLPPQIWSALAGRAFVTKDFSLLDMNGLWQPLSLSPAMTKQDIISILPALAAFFAVISISSREWPVLSWTIVGLALASAIVGLAQRFLGQDSVFNFYHSTDPVTASGFFANHNFLAAQIYTALPFVVVLTLQNKVKQPIMRRILPLFAFLAGAIMIAGLGATGSRMGAVLLVITLLLIVCLVFSKSQSTGFRGGRVSVLSILGLILGSVVIAQLLLAALLRFSETDIASDYRGVVIESSLTTLKAFFPIGSGFGSFVPAYQLFEQPGKMIDAYVNHAHNDWLELLIEGGLPIALILFAFLIWLVVMAFIAWRKNSINLYSKAASISIGMLCIHSLVDYPIRTPALMTMFGLFCGMLTFQRVGEIVKTPRSPKRPSAPVDELPVGFRPSKRGFSNKAGP